jgi:hypothetical protein
LLRCHEEVEVVESAVAVRFEGFKGFEEPPAEFEELFAGLV